MHLLPASLIKGLEFLPIPGEGILYCATRSPTSTIMITPLSTALRWACLHLTPYVRTRSMSRFSPVSAVPWNTTCSRRPMMKKRLNKTTNNRYSRPCTTRTRRSTEVLEETRNGCRESSSIRSYGKMFHFRRRRAGEDHLRIQTRFKRRDRLYGVDEGNSSEERLSVQASRVPPSPHPGHMTLDFFPRRADRLTHREHLSRCTAGRRHNRDNRFSRRGIVEFRSINELVETVDSNKGHSAYRAAAWLIPAGEVYNVTGPGNSILNRTFAVKVGSNRLFQAIVSHACLTRNGHM